MLQAMMSRPPCKFWLEGNCRNGDNCGYPHAIIQCNDYKRGYCKYGVKCRYNHGHPHKLNPTVASERLESLPINKNSVYDNDAPRIVSKNTEGWANYLGYVQRIPKKQRLIKADVVAEPLVAAAEEPSIEQEQRPAQEEPRVVSSDGSNNETPRSESSLSEIDDEVDLSAPGAFANASRFIERCQYSNCVTCDQAPPIVTKRGFSSSNDPYLLEGSHPARLFAAEYHDNFWRHAVARDETRINELPRPHAIALMMAPCELCGRVHIEGVDRINSIDRISSRDRTYAVGKVMTLCVVCNSLKIWLEPNEFMGTARKWSANAANILQFCPEVENMNDFEQRVLHEDITSHFGSIEASISKARKGALDDLSRDHPGSPVLADILTRHCGYCLDRMGHGADRVDSDNSYPLSLIQGLLVTCCGHCNVTMLNRPVLAVLIQLRRIDLHTKTWTMEHPLASRFFASTDNVLSCVLTDRKPVKCTIDSVTIMAPSYHSLKRLVCHLQMEIPTERVSISCYKTWLRTATATDITEIRSALQVQTSVNEPFSVTHYVRDEYLEEWEARLKCEGRRDQIRLLKKSPKVARAAPPVAVARLVVRESEEPELGTSSTIRGGRAPGVSSYPYGIALYSLDNNTLYGRASGIRQVKTWIAHSNAYSQAQVEALLDSGEPCTKGTGGQGSARPICRIRRGREDDDGVVGELTPDGQRVLLSAAAKCPYGAVLETTKGSTLAVCKSRAEASKMLKVGNSKVSNALSLDRTDPEYGKVYKYHGNQRALTTTHRFNVRPLNYDDELGVTALGKKMLPFFTGEE